VLQITEENNNEKLNGFLNFCFVFGGLEFVDHSFAYVGHFVFLRDVWIRDAWPT
jgi:hypothetical protein